MQSPSPLYQSNCQTLNGQKDCSHAVSNIKEFLPLFITDQPHRMYSKGLHHPWACSQTTSMMSKEKELAKKTRSSKGNESKSHASREDHEDIISMLMTKHGALSSKNGPLVCLQLSGARSVTPDNWSYRQCQNQSTLKRDFQQQANTKCL